MAGIIYASCVYIEAICKFHYIFKVVYLEDLIELIAEMVKFQLSNSIYPEYDPVYDTKKDKDYSSNKQKRNRAGGSKHKSTMLMYNKLCEIIQALTELIVTEPLTDTIILKVRHHRCVVSCNVVDHFIGQFLAGIILLSKLYCI